jgi:anti-repressor protein
VRIREQYIQPPEESDPAPVSPERVEDKNQAVPFFFNEHEVRALTGEDGEPWFVARDVCNVLGLANITEALRGLESDEKADFKIPEVSSNGTRQARVYFIISESGLYQLIFKSRKPEAKEFTRWVKREVLPAIRKHGAYMTSDTLEKAILSPDFVIGLATKLKEERARAAELEAQKAKLAQEKIALAEANMALKPKADLHDSLMEAGGAIEMGEAAKVLCRDYPGVGRNKLFHFLRWAGVLMYNDKRYNVPTQRFMNRGFFRVAMKTRDFLNRDYVYPQVYVKPEGMEYIHKLVGKYYDGNTLRYLDTKAA